MWVELLTSTRVLAGSRRFYQAVLLAWILHAFEGVAACEIAKVPVLQG